MDSLDKIIAGLIALPVLWVLWWVMEFARWLSG